MVEPILNGITTIAPYDKLSQARRSSAYKSAVFLHRFCECAAMVQGSCPVEWCRSCKVARRSDRQESGGGRLLTCSGGHRRISGRFAMLHDLPQRRSHTSVAEQKRADFAPNTEHRPDHREASSRWTAPRVRP